ncbi:diacylglycerol kinase family protein [Thalassotalea sediminis]|uniref:diacylglycerol kinase family protein n=1 Tax=Thalassotalea sediminis TaxID=1759089 RepID=UPI002573EAFF|nr:diacylglycerol kinase family protein [Thalassotalea sediminis]
MFITKYYVLGAITAFICAALVNSFYFSVVFYWIGLSLASVSLAYIFDIPSTFRKKSNGSIPLYIRWVFIPFLLGAQLYNSWARKNDSVPAIQKINEHLYLACRLFPSDMERLKQEGIHGILDVTAEFDGVDWSAESAGFNYLNIPVLDHKAPSKRKLIHAINWLESQRRQNKNVVVHCALGRGRSVMVVAAYLLAKGSADSTADALNIIKKIRETAGLNNHQLRKLNKLHSEHALVLGESLALIANPVSGGGKWPEYRREVVNLLTKKYVVKIKETTPDVSAKTLAEEAIKAGEDKIVACGGDGTLTEVAQKIVSTNKKMGILPMGTANALAHVLLGIKTKLDPVTVACQALLENKEKRIDTAKCNDELMLLVAGIGFEHRMIKGADRKKKDDGGQFAYLQAFLEAVSANKRLTLRVSFDDQPEDTIETSSLVVANAAPFTTLLAQGGGNPDIDDGLLDITWLPESNDITDHLMGLTELAIAGIQQNVSSPTCHHKTAKKLSIVSDHELEFVIDGELRKAEQLNIEVLPKSLSLILPDETT